MSGASLTRRTVLGLIAAAACGGVSAFQGERAVGDTVEGAMWRMQMTSRARKDTSRFTRFRVSDGAIYQRVEPKKDAAEEVVGKDLRKGKAPGSTVLEFEKLRVFVPGAERGSKGELIKGTARIGRDEFGKFHGRLIDGNGHHWDLTLTRFKE